MNMAEPTDESVALLARMAAKPGVQATLILSRADGAILRADNVASLLKKQKQSVGRQINNTAADQHEQSSGRAHAASIANADGVTAVNGVVGNVDDGTDAARQNDEQVARIVWKFVKATESAVEDLDEEDEVRLLRVRTKRNEIVVVPSSKFLLVVVHDTPPA